MLIIDDWVIASLDWLQHMHHPANYVHREMASLPVATASVTPSERNHKKEKKKDKSAADEKRCRRSRSTVQANDQPEMKEQNKRDRSQQRQHFFGMLPSSSTMAKQPQQLTQQPLQSDVESMVSGYVYTGMDRDIAEEFILHSMTIPTPATQASSVKSGFSTNKREVFWNPPTSLRVFFLYNEHRVFSIDLLTCWFEILLNIRPLRKKKKEILRDCWICCCIV